MTEPLAFTYRNYRGEVSERRVMPQATWYGQTPWHPEPQWLLTAIDLDKNESRDFAMKDISFTAALSGSPQVEAGMEPRGCPTPGACSCPREQEGGEAPVPFAWAYQRGNDLPVLINRRADKLHEGWTETPLYAHPAPLPADGWVAGAEAMRELVAKVCDGIADIWQRVEPPEFFSSKERSQDYRELAAQVRTMPLPTPPASTEGGAS